MKYMFFACLCVYLSCANNEIEAIDSETLVVNSFIKGRYLVNSGDFKFDNYLVDVQIINPSDSVAKFWMFSCSGDFNITLDNTNFEITRNICDANFPVLIELKPNQSLTVSLLIELKGIHTEDLSIMRIGFIHIYESQHDFVKDLLSTIETFKNENRQIIWANELDFSEINYNPYTIK